MGNTMSHHEFNELRDITTALPSEQMRQLRDELGRTLSTLPPRRPILTPILPCGLGKIMPTRWTSSLPTLTASGRRKNGGNLTIE